jgi:hypothetical protein
VHGDSTQEREEFLCIRDSEKLGLGYIIELGPQSETHNGDIRPILVFGEDYDRSVVGDVLDALNPKAVAEGKNGGSDRLEKSINQVIPLLLRNNTHLP